MIRKVKSAKKVKAIVNPCSICSKEGAVYQVLGSKDLCYDCCSGVLDILNARKSENSDKKLTGANE